MEIFEYAFMQRAFIVGILLAAIIVYRASDCM